MKTTLCLMLFMISVMTGRTQEFNTIFGPGRIYGGYGVISNKFTTINGDYANIAEVYGGWLVNRRFMLGLGFAGSTNDIRVPVDFSTMPTRRMTYQYGQAGLMMEYILWPRKAVHFTYQLFTGAGFTAQYERYRSFNQYDNFGDNDIYDHNYFFVLEPGIQLEMNLFRWMRLSPGVSWRNTFGSNGRGVDDSGLSDVSYTIALKFGKFW